MNDLPGYEIEEVLGEVFGLTVRSRNVGSQIGASFKSLVGGELKGMTKQLAASRIEAQSRLVEEAEAKGGNAIVAFRFDTSELGSTWTEICAYGTAVRARRALIRGFVRRPVGPEPARAPDLVARVLGELEDRAPRRPAQLLLEQRGDGGTEPLALLGGRPRRMSHCTITTGSIAPSGPVRSTPFSPSSRNATVTRSGFVSITSA